MKKPSVILVYAVFFFFFVMFIALFVSCSSRIHMNAGAADVNNNGNEKNVWHYSEKAGAGDFSSDRMQKNEIIQELHDIKSQIELQNDSIRAIQRQLYSLKAGNGKFKADERKSFFRKTEYPHSRKTGHSYRKAGNAGKETGRTRSSINKKLTSSFTASNNIRSHDKSGYSGYSQSEKLYKKARSLLLEDNFKQAEILFRKFIKKYPENELSDNSFYWLGECHYSMGDYQGAVKIFKTLIKRYPKGDKVPDALLKIAYSYLAVDDTDRAAYYLKQVVTKYPFSEAGDKAELKLKDFK